MEPHYDAKLLQEMERRINSKNLALIRLREIAGITQRELAQIVGKNLTTIKVLELGRLKLSQKLAEKISLETGISAKWLLDKMAETEPVDIMGRPYTKATFDAAREKYCLPPDTTPPFVKAMGAEISLALTALFINKTTEREALLMVRKIRRAVFELYMEFSPETLGDIHSEHDFPAMVHAAIADFRPEAYSQYMEFMRAFMNANDKSTDVPIPTLRAFERSIELSAELERLQSEIDSYEAKGEVVDEPDAPSEDQDQGAGDHSNKKPT